MRANSKIPLNSLQRRYAALFERFPEYRVNNINVVFEWEGPLDLSVFAWSLERLAERHPLLNVTFADDGQSMRPGPAGRFVAPIEVSRFTAEDDDAWLQHLKACAYQESRICFDLRTGPLYRFLLIERRADAWAMIFTMHHMITDGWSVRVVIKELAEIYRAARAQTPAELPPLHFSHTNAVEMEEDFLASEEAERRRQWWRRQLSTYSWKGAGSADAPCGETLSVERYLSAEETRAFGARLKDDGFRLNNALLTIFHDALELVSGEPGPMIKNVLAGRQTAEQWQPVSNLMNILPVRLQQSGDASTGERIRRMSAAVAEAGEKILPFWHLVERELPWAYLNPVGPSPYELNIYMAQSEYWIDWPEMKIRRIQAAIPATAWSQFELCLLSQPSRDGSWTMRMLFDSAKVTAEKAAGVLDTTLGLLDDYTTGTPCG